MNNGILYGSLLIVVLMGILGTQLIGGIIGGLIGVTAGLIFVLLMYFLYL